MLESPVGTGLRDVPTAGPGHRATWVRPGRQGRKGGSPWGSPGSLFGGTASAGGKGRGAGEGPYRRLFALCGGGARPGACVWALGLRRRIARAGAGGVRCAPGRWGLGNGVPRAITPHRCGRRALRWYGSRSCVPTPVVPLPRQRGPLPPPGLRRGTAAGGCRTRSTGGCGPAAWR